MTKLKKYLAKIFWSESQNDMVLASEEEAQFNIRLGKLLIGTLEYSDSMWHFCYSNDFKIQNRILPLTNFPSKEKDYYTRDLWPFFASRIPSNAQLQIDNDNPKDDLVTLLRRFGRKTIANPYELSPVF